MSIKIYHNPRCSKSRQTLEIIKAKGYDPEIVEYLKDALSLDDIKGIFKALGLDSALPMVRTKEPEFAEAGLSRLSSNEELLVAIAKYPKLLERPIVISDKGARIGRPPEIVEEILK